MTDDTTTTSTPPADNIESVSPAKPVLPTAQPLSPAQVGTPTAKSVAGSKAGGPVVADGTASKTEAGQKASPERRASRSGKVPVDEIAAGISLAGRQMSSKLRELLMGTVAVRVVDRSRAFVFDPKAEGFPVQESSGPGAKSAKADCVIDLTETSLQRMWNGELNPQIAMLSDKVTISGKAELAVYFFNLVSPK